MTRDDRWHRHESPVAPRPGRTGPGAWWLVVRRWLLLVVAAVLLAAGVASVAGQVRSWLGEDAAAATPVAGVPDEALAGLAAAVAVEYLSWDQSAREVRRAALAQVAAPDTAVDGWGGTGRQWADSPAVIGLVRRDQDTGVVTVRVRVVPFVRDQQATAPTPSPAPDSPPPVPSSTARLPSVTPPAAGQPAPGRIGAASGGAGYGGAAGGLVPGEGAGGWVARPPRWVNLAVPVAWQDGRVVVTAVPALVGAPQQSASGPAVAGTGGGDDPAFAAQVKALVTRFLEAYAAGDLELVRASGSALAGLDGAVQLREVTGWRAARASAADAGRRVGDVTVIWSLADGAGSLRCTYRLELRLEQGRWFLAAAEVAVAGR